jgi:hypothetical protein
LTTIGKNIHTDSQLQNGKSRKAAVLGRVRISDDDRKMIINKSLRKVNSALSVS